MLSSVASSGAGVRVRLVRSVRVVGESALIPLMCSVFLPLTSEVMRSVPGPAATGGTRGGKSLYKGAHAVEVNPGRRWVPWSVFYRCRHSGNVGEALVDADVRSAP